MRIYVRRDLVHLDSSGPPGVSSRLLGSYPSTPSVCLCVCVYTHIHTHTLPPALKIEKTQTQPYLSFFQKSPLTPSNKRSHRIVEPPHPHSPMLNETNCTYVRYRERHIYIYTHTHIYIYTYTCTCTYTYIYIHTYTHIHVHTHIHVYIYINAYIYVYTHICIHTCMNIAHMHIL